jgi:hypothetical protein
MIRRANISLFSMDAVKPIPIKTDPIMQQAIKMTNELGYSSQHPLYFDVCQQIYYKLTTGNGVHHEYK